MKKEIKYEDVISFKSLIESADLCGQEVTWKASVQMFLVNKCLWVADLHQKLL